jgi:hypothetical protein
MDRCERFADFVLELWELVDVHRHNTFDILSVSLLTAVRLRFRVGAKRNKLAE